jgi:hypothetical protein
MPLAVVQGATLKCDQCPATSPLIVTSTTSWSKVEGKLPATVQDHLPGANVPPFPGVCAILGINCVPLTLLPWGGTFKQILLTLLSSEILGDDAKLKCLVGGTISVIDPNQSTTSVGLARAEEELGDLLRELWEKDQDLDIAQIEEQYAATLRVYSIELGADSAVATRGGIPGAVMAAILAAGTGGLLYAASEANDAADDINDDAEEVKRQAEEAAETLRRERAKAQEEADDERITAELIPGKQHRRYDSGLLRKRFGEVKKIAEGKGERAQKAKKIVNKATQELQQRRIGAKVKSGDIGKRPGGHK